MKARTVRLIDATGRPLGTGQLDEQGEHFAGTLDSLALPLDMKALFEEFEEIVNGQMFSFLDAIQAKINSLGIKVIFDDGSEAYVRDLQIFPSTGDFSFKLAQAPIWNGKTETQPGSQYPTVSTQID
jgi:hypothetical protein